MTGTYANQTVCEREGFKDYNTEKLLLKGVLDVDRPLIPLSSNCAIKIREILATVFGSVMTIIQAWINARDRRSFAMAASSMGCVTGA